MLEGIQLIFALNNLCKANSLISMIFLYFFCILWAFNVFRNWFWNTNKIHKSSAQLQYCTTLNKNPFLLKITENSAKLPSITKHHFFQIYFVNLQPSLIESNFHLNIKTFTQPNNIISNLHDAIFYAKHSTIYSKAPATKDLSWWRATSPSIVF